MKYVAIGDIHGRHDLLERLLVKALTVYPDHKLLFLGDYIDRGDNSEGVISAIRKLCETGFATAVMGNHEAMMIQYVNEGIGSSDHIWLWNGGRKTIHSYQEAIGDYTLRGFKKSVSRDLEWIKSLPLFYETDEIFASHAPVSKEAGKGDFRKNDDELYWTYEPVQTITLEETGSYNHGKLAVCGHIHRLKEGVILPRIYPHIIYADTGCGCATWGPLTGVVIEDGKYVSYFQEV